MKFQFAILPLSIRRRTARLKTEIYAYQVACYLLCSTGKGRLAVIAKEFDCRIIGTANLQQPAVKMNRRQVVKPLAGIISSISAVAKADPIHNNFTKFAKI
jgi:hypothetical protein